MGINYSQYCIYGVKLENCRKILSEDIYEEQPRYNVKIGKQSHVEKVLVKEEEYIYEALDLQAPELYELEELIREKYPHLDVICDDENECIYLGQYLGNTVDFGRVDLIEGTVDKLPSEEKINDQEWKIHFVTSVG